MVSAAYHWVDAYLKFLTLQRGKGAFYWGVGLLICFIAPDGSSSWGFNNVAALILAILGFVHTCAARIPSLASHARDAAMPLCCQLQDHQGDAASPRAWRGEPVRGGRAGRARHAADGREHEQHEPVDGPRQQQRWAQIAGAWPFHAAGCIAGHCASMLLVRRRLRSTAYPHPRRRRCRRAPRASKRRASDAAVGDPARLTLQ